MPLGEHGAELGVTRYALLQLREVQRGLTLRSGAGPHAGGKARSKRVRGS